MLPSPSATSKPSTPPPPKPVETQAKPAQPQPAQTQTGQGQPKTDTGTSTAGAKPAQQTGYQAAGVQDGYEAQKTSTQRAQGDTFEAKSGGGGLGDALLDAAKTVAKPIVDAAAPIVEPIARAAAPVVAPIVEGAQAVGSAIGKAIAPAIGSIDELQDRAVINKLAEIGQPGVLEEAANPPDGKKPAEGMTAEQQKAYDALPPDQRQRYDELHEQAADTWKYRTVGPEATIITPSSAVKNLREALTQGNVADYLKVEDALAGSTTQRSRVQDARELLFQGKLSDSKMDRNGQSALDALANLAKGGTTQVGVDRTELLGQIARDMNHPEQIKQGRDNADCGGSTAAFVMALTQPAEYARMIQGLGENGKVELTPEWAKFFGAGSNEMKLNEKFDAADPRSVTQQLFAKTFDQEAVNQQQPVEAPPAAAEAAAAQGITGQQLKDGLNDKGILGGGWDAVYLPPAKDPNNPSPGVTDAQRAEATKVAEQMIDEASPRKPVMVNVDNHWVTVLGHDKDGKYWIKDPMSGAVNQVTREDLTTDLNSVVYQTRHVKAEVPEYMHNAEWAKPGGGGPLSGGTSSGGGSGGSN